MIETRYCPQCGANEIRVGVPICSTCDIANRGDDLATQLRADLAAAIARAERAEVLNAAWYRITTSLAEATSAEIAYDGDRPIGWRKPSSGSLAEAIGIGRGARAAGFAEGVEAALAAIAPHLKVAGCWCDCGHDSEGHNDECKLCLAHCIEMAVRAIARKGA